MRVISGTLKGRNIEGFNLDGTRPTMDRVKESLFASIQNYIEGATVLDLFAGSGNLGIEAISNGSDFVYFCDKNSEAVKVINKNLDNFRIKDKALVYNLDYMECLKILSNNKKSFDIIFLDPPYAMEVLSDVIEFVLSKNLLKDNGIIVCEVGNDYLKDYNNLTRIKEKKYGDKYIIVFKKARVPILFKRSTSAFEDGNDVLDNFDSLRLTSSAVFWG